MDKDMLIFRPCPLCKSNDFIVKYKRNYSINDLKEELFSARRERKKSTYEHNTFLRCKNCNMIYASPIISPVVVERLYKKSKYNYGKEEENLKRSYGDCLKKATKYLKDKGKILDIGAGNGFFLLEAIGQGFKEKDVYGIEPSKHAYELADKKIKKNILNDILRNKQFKEDFFEVICLFQVIDHIEEPNDVLKICYQFLKPGGVILIISHNVESLSARIMGEKSPIFDIEHTQLFSKKTISKILKKNGFKVRDILEVKNTYSMGYWLTASPIPKRLKNPIRRLLTNSGLIESKITIKPGNFCVIAQK